MAPVTVNAGPNRWTGREVPDPCGITRRVIPARAGITCRHQNLQKAFPHGEVQAWGTGLLSMPQTGDTSRCHLTFCTLFMIPDAAAPLLQAWTSD